MKQLISLVCLLACSIVGNAQSAMPAIMAFPADGYCHEHGYVIKQQTADGEQETPDYGRFVMEDRELTGMIDILNSMMAERGFQMKSLSHTVKDLHAKGAEAGDTLNMPLYKRILESTGTTIIVTLDYKLARQIAIRKEYAYTVSAVDAKSGKAVASVSGNGFPSTDTVQEAFKFFMAGRIDEFSYQLMEYFRTLVQ